MATVKIKGMSCQHCVESVTKTLSAIPGIAHVKVDLANGEASYEGDIDIEKVREMIKKIGFQAE